MLLAEGPRPSFCSALTLKMPPFRPTAFSEVHTQAQRIFPVENEALGSAATVWKNSPEYLKAHPELPSIELTR